jgi:ABC-type nitrate/sulfonate/bicarbonate transport system substrate-binding protein
MFDRSRRISVIFLHAHGINYTDKPRHRALGCVRFSVSVQHRPAEVLQKIRIGVPSVALTYMPFYVAQEKGFLAKAGLEAEYIQMNTGIQPQAVINGNINFFPSLSTGISAAVAGLPLVVVLNFYNITPWMLVTSKDINKPQDLLGKKNCGFGNSHYRSSIDDGVVQEI